MSCYEWENGTLTLPSAAVAALKKELRDFGNDLHDRVRAEAVRLHREVGKGTRSVATYRQRMHAAQRAGWDTRNRSTSWYAPARDAQVKDLATQCAYNVLDWMLMDAERGGTIHQPTLADVNRVAPKYTNRDEHFAVLGTEGYTEASISFDGRQVTWSVEENNHACERARESLMAGRFFDALSRVQWTRGTGGVIVGNDEYNRDNRESGGGGNYTKDTFGPVGEDHRVFEYTRSGLSLSQARRLVRDSARRSARVY